MNVTVSRRTQDAKTSVDPHEQAQPCDLAPRQAVERQEKARALVVRLTETRGAASEKIASS
eukprot:55920-Eustigmatos_ZCMA.PRE.1